MDIFKKGMLGAFTGEEPAEKLPTSDTDEETEEQPASDTKSETEEHKETDPLKQLMEDTGLAKTYDTPEAALKAVSEKNRYIEEQREENRRLHDLLRQQLNTQRQMTPPPPKPTAEEFVNRFTTQPEEVLRAYDQTPQINALSSDLAQLKAQQHNQALAMAVSKREDIANVAPYISAGQPPPPGTNAVWDKMWELHTRQGINAQGPEATIDILHRLATQEPKALKASPKQKQGATTTGRGRKAPSLSGDEPDWNAMTADEIRSEFEKHGMVS